MAELQRRGPPHVGRYHLGPVIGRGGMGVVHRGHDPLLQRAVAIKVVEPRGPRAERSAALRREARVVARLDHPGIVPVHDLVEHDGRLHVVMPLIEGQTLRDLLDAGPLGIPAAIAVAYRIAEALRYSHARGVVHRDIKPENVMVVEQGRRDLRIKLMDFGLAVTADAPAPDEQGRICGTLGYLSPEQTLGLPVDARSDLYALGVVIFECCTGQLPYGRLEEPRVTPMLQLAPRLGLHCADVPEALDGLVAACLHADPGCRPSSTDQVGSTLRELFEVNAGPLELGARGSSNGTTEDQPTIDVARVEASPSSERPARPLGAILLVHGEYDAAERAFDAERRARGRAPTLAEEIEEHRWAANLAHKRGAYEQAIQRCDEGLRQLAGRGIAQPHTAAALHAWAALAAIAGGWLPTGRERVAAAEREVARVPPGREYAEAMALVLRAQGNLHMAEANVAGALDILARALQHAERHDDAWERSIARFNLGEAHAMAGQPEEALAHLVKAAEGKQRIGDRWGLAYLHHTWALVYLDRSELAPAEARLALGASLSEAIGDPKLMAMHEIGRGEVARQRGQWAEARARADAAVAAARRHRSHAEECGALVLQARLRRAAGEVHEALAFARGALELAAPAELGVPRAAALIEQAHALGVLGEHDAAACRLDEAASLVETWGHPVRRLEVEVGRLEHAARVESRAELDARTIACRAEAERHGTRRLHVRILLATAEAARRWGDGHGAARRRALAQRIAHEAGAYGWLDQPAPEPVPNAYSQTGSSASNSETSSR